MKEIQLNSELEGALLELPMEGPVAIVDPEESSLLGIFGLIVCCNDRDN